MCSLGRMGVGFWLAVVVSLSLAGCSSGTGGEVIDGMPTTAQIVTDTSFLADIAQNVVDDRLFAVSLVPAGVDPHVFEPTPKDSRLVAESRVAIINVAGLMPAVDALIENTRSSGTPLIEAAAGLPNLDSDPHCWLDPLAVVTYVDNIAAGLALVDPGGEAAFRANADAYAESLGELDAWIVTQVQTIPPERRLLVTNHESLGRFAARYGFKIVGTIFRNTMGEGSPSARQLTELVTSIRATGAPAVFLETGANADLAEQVAAETGIKVVTDLYTHSLGEGASTYLEMMRWNVTKIVEALR